MKKLIYLLVLCLCLNGAVPVLAEGGGAKVTSTTSEKEAASKKKAKKKAEKEAKKKAEEEAKKKAEKEAKKKAEEEAKKKAEKEAKKKAEKEAAQKAGEMAEPEQLAEEGVQEAEAPVKRAVAPAEAPAEPPAEAPAEQPAEAPAEPPAEAPVEQPAEAPAEQPAEGPAEQPAEAPAEQPAEAPVEQPAEAPAEQPAEAPAEAPAEPPAEAPAEAPAEPTEAPTEPTEAPTEPTEAPTEPTEAPAEPTEAPAEPTEAPAEPTEAPVEPTEAPAEPTEAPEETEAPEATEAPELPEDAETWFERDGVKLGGKLKDTIALLNGDEKLYLRVRKPVLVKDVPLKRLSGVRLLPDEEVFEGEYEALVSRDNPEDIESPEPIDLKTLEDCKDDDKADLYFWVREVGQAPEPTVAPTEAPEPTPAPVLTVKAKHFEPAKWLKRAPQFKLSGKPEDEKWMYAAIIYDERIIPMSGDTYVPEQEGVYTLRFALLDGIGDIISASEQYTVWLDMTPPEEVDIQVDESADYTLYVTAADAMSGVKKVSLNGGKKWHDLADGETFTYIGKKARTFPAGDILVKDAAGNVFESTQEYTVDKAEQEEPPDNGGGWGGGGGNGESKPAKTHAAGDGEDKAEYDAVALEVPEEPMKQLTLGGEEMALSLVLESAQGPDAPVGEDRLFTATLCHWDAPAPVDADGEPRQPDPGEDPEALNTLLLSAQLDDGLGERFTYEWRFNGEVYRLLSNSGIRYVALKVGDDVAAFPTEGFTGGTKYTELKMLGVSTRKFDYTLAMKVNRDPSYMSAMSDSDFSQACDLSIRVEVENMAYELSGSTNSIMYFYDVYLGPEAMLKQPFGEYRAQ